jgi:hypothetical protein
MAGAQSNASIDLTSINKEQETGSRFKWTEAMAEHLLELQLTKEHYCAEIYGKV